MSEKTTLDKSATQTKPVTGSKFVYVTYIKTTQQKLWDALIKPEFTRQYWFGSYQECDWSVGASWKLMLPDVGCIDSGEVLSIDAPNKLVLSWQNHKLPEREAEGFSTATFLLEPTGELIKLTVIHEMAVDNSKLIEAVSNGWPAVLSSLQSLLETGKAHPGTDTFKPCA